MFSQTDTVRQKYASMETDDATGLNHTLWRKDDNLSGRWTSPDPYGGSMSTANPQSFNRYTYCSNDPVNHVDRLGLEIWDPSSTDASHGFAGWGGTINFNGSHFGGPGVLNLALARHNFAVSNDANGGHYGDSTPYDDYAFDFQIQ
jgi:RHS repeat-associated protein